MWAWLRLAVVGSSFRQGITTSGGGTEAHISFPLPVEPYKGLAHLTISPDNNLT
jgi:hypothetical protein